MKENKEQVGSKQDKKELSGKKMVLILGVVAIVAAAVVIVIFLTRTPEAEPLNNFPIVDESNIADIEASIRDRVEKGMFETHMNTTWIFPDGESASTDAIMGNSSNNNYPFYFEIIVEGETVFTSSLLLVGSQIKEIKLDKDLDAGTYAAVVKVHLMDENGEAINSQVGFNITLDIKN